MAPPTAEELSPQAVEPVEEYTLKFYFRPVAWAYVGAFFSTMLVSGIVTFTATDYSPQTDKITLYYGMFNPCIWFDHYPAKVFATIGIGIFILIGIEYSCIFFLYVYCEQRLFKAMWVGGVALFATLVDLTFVNVFTTNLYPVPDSSDEARRLHGVHMGMNNTLSLLEESEYELTKADIFTIELHTIFYILWVVGQLVFALSLVQRGNLSMDTWSRGRRICTLATLVLGFYGMAMHAAAMLIIVMQDVPKKEWYFNKKLASILQDMIVLIDAATLTSAWGWLPIMLFRLIMPSGRGVALTFKLQSFPGDKGWVSPEQWMKQAVWCICAVLAWGGVCLKRWKDDIVVELQLLEVMREKPYAYFGAPLYLLSIIVLAFGLTFSVIAQRLTQRKMPVLFAIHAGIFFLAVFTSLLAILDQANWSRSVAWCAHFAIFTWVIHMNTEVSEGGSSSIIKAIAYCLVGLILEYFVFTTSHWWLLFVYLAWFALYGEAVPDLPKIYVAAVAINEEGYEKMEQDKVTPTP